MYMLILKSPYAFKYHCIEGMKTSWTFFFLLFYYSAWCYNKYSQELASLYPHSTECLCSEHTCASDSLDFFLCTFAEEFSLDDHWLLGQMPLAKNLVISLETKKIAKCQVYPIFNCVTCHIITSNYTIEGLS